MSLEDVYVLRLLRNADVLIAVDAEKSQGDVKGKGPKAKGRKKAESVGSLRDGYYTPSLISNRIPNLPSPPWSPLHLPSPLETLPRKL